MYDIYSCSIDSTNDKEKEKAELDNFAATLARLEAELKAVGEVRGNENSFVRSLQEISQDIQNQMAIYYNLQERLSNVTNAAMIKKIKLCRSKLDALLRKINPRDDVEMADADHSPQSRRKSEYQSIILYLSCLFQLRLPTIYFLSIHFED